MCLTPKLWEFGKIYVSIEFLGLVVNTLKSVHMHANMIGKDSCINANISDQFSMMRETDMSTE